MSFNPVRLNQLFAITGRPDFVKRAADQSPVEDVPDRAWGDRDGRRFPYHTKEAAFISAVEAADEQAPAQVQDLLKLAAAHWGIAEQVEAALTKLAESKVEVPLDQLGDSAFLLVADHAGSRLRKFAAVDAQSLEGAAKALFENRNRYPLEWRKTAALRCLAKAEKTGTRFDGPVGDWLQKAAGFGYPTVDAIDNAVIQRHLEIRDPEIRCALEKLASQMVDNPAARMDREIVDGFVQALDEIDRHTKIARHYGETVGLPEDVLDCKIDDLVKMAGASGDIVQLQNGKSIEVSSIPREALEGVDPGLAKMASDQLRAVLPTLPRPDADLLVRLIG